MKRDAKNKAAAAAERIRVAHERGRDLARRTAKALEGEGAPPLEQAALAEEYAALLAEYRDVYPSPPKSPEVLRAEAEALREAELTAQEAEAARRLATRQLEDARRGFDAALNEITRPQGKPGKPN